MREKRELHIFTLKDKNEFKRRFKAEYFKNFRWTGIPLNPGIPIIWISFRKAWIGVVKNRRFFSQNAFQRSSQFFYRSDQNRYLSRDILNQGIGFDSRVLFVGEEFQTLVQIDQAPSQIKFLDIVDADFRKIIGVQRLAEKIHRFLEQHERRLIVIEFAFDCIFQHRIVWQTFEKRIDETILLFQRMIEPIDFE